MITVTDAFVKTFSKIGQQIGESFDSEAVRLIRILRSRRESILNGVDQRLETRNNFFALTTHLSRKIGNRVKAFDFPQDGEEAKGRDNRNNFYHV